MRNAEMRIAQPKPWLVTKWETMMGRRIPPKLAPLTIIPKANARRFWNQVPTALIAIQTY